jgi:hypothetical protein
LVVEQKMDVPTKHRGIVRARIEKQSELAKIVNLVRFLEFREVTTRAGQREIRGHRFPTARSGNNVVDVERYPRSDFNKAAVFTGTARSCGNDGSKSLAAALHRLAV